MAKIRSATREASNSITHLVKIVANEEIDKRMRELAVHKINIQDAEERVMSHMLSSLTSSLEKAGRPWSSEEDDLLVAEVRVGIAQIAKNHKRSIGAIGSRINQKELIRY